jgi:hypothetical protein
VSAFSPIYAAPAQAKDRDRRPPANRVSSHEISGRGRIDDPFFSGGEYAKVSSA